MRLIGHIGRHTLQRWIVAVAALVAAVVLVPDAADAERRADRDRDGLSDRYEVRRSKTNPRRRDTDRDGLSDRYELRRSNTNPRRRDTDRDGLSDRYELRRSKTNPRRRDTDRDGLTDGYELRTSKTDPRTADKQAAGRPADTDGDGLTDRYEMRTSRTDPLNPDTDGDGLSDGYEVKVSRTNPRLADTDGDWLSDGEEVLLGYDPLDPSSPAPPPVPDTAAPQVSLTAPEDGTTVSDTVTVSATASDDRDVSAVQFQVDGRNVGSEDSTAPYAASWDTAGHDDGTHALTAVARDGAGNETTAAPVNVSVRNVADPPADLTPPNTTIDSGPSGTTTSTSASFGFSSSEVGAAFDCRLDGDPWSGCSSPKAYSGLTTGSHTFEVRAKDAAGNVDSTPAQRTWTVDGVAPVPVVDGEVSSASQLLSRAKDPASDGKTFYVRGGSYGNLDFRGVRRGALVTFLAYPGEQPVIDTMVFSDSHQLRFDGFRASGVDIQPGSSSTWNRNLQFANCTLGGTSSNRLSGRLAVVGVREFTEDVLFDRCDVGWTLTGSTDQGYGFRIVNGNYGPIRRFTVQRSRVHHVACDAFQIGGAEQFVLDRTEIAYVGSQPGYDCHADSIQVMSFGGNLNRITNNYIHHTGYYDEHDNPPNWVPAGQFLYHNGSSGGALIENNLFIDNRNYTPYLGGGCGGCATTLNNVVLRRNTITRNGTAFGGDSANDLIWAATSGSGNAFDRNIVGGIGVSGNTSAASFTGNVYTHQGKIGPTDTGPTSLDFDSHHNCTSAACADAGYRTPTDTHWAQP